MAGLESVPLYEVVHFDVVASDADAGVEPVNRGPHILLTILLGVTSSVLIQSEARACSCRAPRHRALVGPAVVVPSNAPGVPVVEPMSQEFEGLGLHPEGSYTLAIRGDDGEMVPVVEEVLVPRERYPFDGLAVVRPLGGFSAGAVYSLGYTDADGAATVLSEIRVVDPIDFPESLGVVELSRWSATVLQARGSGGMCARPVSTHAMTVDLTVSGDVWPWMDVLVFRTLVDDTLWWPMFSSCDFAYRPHRYSHASSVTGVDPGDDLLLFPPAPFVSAGNPVRLRVGSQVVVHAVLLGSDFEWETAPAIVDFTPEPGDESAVEWETVPMTVDFASEVGDE